MIKMQHLPQGTEAVAVCDVCGKLITDSSAGVVHYKADQPEGEQFHNVFHVHKGACQAHARDEHGAEGRPWHELIAHLNELRRNTGTSFKDLLLREANERKLPPEQYDRLCRKADELTALLDEPRLLTPAGRR